MKTDIVKVLDDYRMVMNGRKFEVIHHYFNSMFEIIRCLDGNDLFNGYLVDIKNCEIITLKEKRKQKLGNILNEIT